MAVSINIKSINKKEIIVDELSLQLPLVLQNTRYQKETFISNSCKYKGKNKIMFKSDMEKIKKAKEEKNNQ